MICPKCGAEVADGVKFCGNCGNPMSDPGTYQIPPQGSQTYDYTQPSQPVDYTQVPPKKPKTGLIILIIVLAIVLIIGGSIAWFVHTVRKAANTYINEYEDDYETLEDIDIDDIDLDDINVDIEGLDDAIESMESLDFSDSLDNDTGTDDYDVITDDETTAVSDAEEYAYGYADVTIAGNDITIIPNGGLNGSTVLYGGKDLDGFLDYVDDTVLEEGRVINREFFYDLLSTMLVDSSMYPEFGDVESNMIMCLAMANNFHNIDVRVKEADLDANNAAEYHYQVKAENRDDTWIVNYADRTVYFNNGSTEYSSDMFKDEYLAYWMMAIEDYYGYSSF